MQKIHDIFFIGERFYRDSSTIMSSLYEKTDESRFEFQYNRISFNDIQSILEARELVYLRPATNDEMLWAYQELDRIIKTWKLRKQGEK